MTSYASRDAYFRSVLTRIGSLARDRAMPEIAELATEALCVLPEAQPLCFIVVVVTGLDAQVVADEIRSHLESVAGVEHAAVQFLSSGGDGS